MLLTLSSRKTAFLVVVVTCLGLLLSACGTADNIAPDDSTDPNRDGSNTKDVHQFVLSNGTIDLPATLYYEYRRENPVDITTLATTTINHNPATEVDSLSTQALEQHQVAVSRADAPAERVIVHYDQSTGFSTQSHASPNLLSLPIPAEQDATEFIAALEGNARVRLVERDEPVWLARAVAPADEELQQQWGAYAVGAPFAWVNYTDIESVTVAVVDSGFDTSHEDLDFLEGINLCPANTVEECTNGGIQYSRDPSGGDEQHGTHVASIIASKHNTVGTAGLAPNARIVPVKVFPDEGDTTYTSIIIDGIRWAAGLHVDGLPTNPNPARVINVSLGAAGDTQALAEVIQDVNKHGVVVVAAAGNESQEGQAPVNYPAQYPTVIAVGAVTPTLERAPFSNYNIGVAGIDIVAPGVQVLAAQPGGYGFMLGTSMSTPHVAAAAAALLGKDHALTPGEVTRILKESAYFDSSNMNRDEYGAGLLRLDGALGLPAPTSPGERHQDITYSLTDSDGHSHVVTSTLDLLTGRTPTAALNGYPRAETVDVTLNLFGDDFEAVQGEGTL